MVCTDPVGTSQIISQSANDMAIWIEEKTQAISEMNFDFMMSMMEQKTEANNQMVATQNITDAEANTANLEMQSKFQVSPLVCDNISTSFALTESLDDAWCESSDDSTNFGLNIATGCAEGDANCKIPFDDLIESVVNHVADATGGDGEVDGTKISLSGVIPGLAEGGYTKSVEESERVKDYLSLAFVSKRPKKMPVDPDGSPIDEKSTKEAKAAYSRWVRDVLISTSAYNSAMRVSTLTDPRTVDGVESISILENIINKVNHYNSKEMLLKYANAENKKCLRDQRKISTSEKEFEVWRNSDAGEKCMANFTSPELLSRYVAEMTAFGSILDQMILESSLVSETQSSIQTQILLDIKNVLSSRRQR